MKVSIVTISFNQGQYLERAIRSVLEQTYSDIEYIVVDPGSTDGSRDIIEKYRDRISRIVFEPDEGPVDGLNKGFALATGQIFGFLNSDDVLFPEAVERAVDVLQRHPDTGAVSGHGYMIDEKGRVMRRFYSDRAHPWWYSRQACYVMQQSTFFRREAFETAGRFDKAAKIWWDGELFLEMSKLGCQFKVVNEFWSAFTIHSESLTGQEQLTLHTERAQRHRKLMAEGVRRFYYKGTGEELPAPASAKFYGARLLRHARHPWRTAIRICEKLGFQPDGRLRIPV